MDGTLYLAGIDLHFGSRSERLLFILKKQRRFLEGTLRATTPVANVTWRGLWMACGLILTTHDVHDNFL